MWTDFYERVQSAQSAKHTDLVLLINPNMHQLPLPIQRYDEPLLPYTKSLITATRDLVCAYILDFASFMSTGAAGAIALERAVRFIGADHPCILHGPFTGTGYSNMADVTGFGVDALTVTNESDARHYFSHPPYGAFVVKDDTPQDLDRGGIYSPRHQRLILVEPGHPVIRAQVTADTLLSKCLTQDFDLQLQLALQQLKDQIHE